MTIRLPVVAKVSTWAEWFTAAGVEGVDVSRGLRFNSADHALDAAGEGAGVLLAHDVLAYDDLRTGRLVIAVEFALRSQRAYHFVCPKSRREHPQVQAFRTVDANRRWLRSTGVRIYPAARVAPARVALTEAKVRPRRVR